jgi:hypothetical protein
VAWTEYEYFNVWHGEQDFVVKQPRIEVDLIKGDQLFHQSAIVDSGSDLILVSADIAQVLGINLLGCKPISARGITGEKVDGYLCEIGVKVEKFDEVIHVMVVFVEGLHTNMLLGQHGFFRYFRVKFEQDRNKFALQRAPRSNP